MLETLIALLLWNLNTPDFQNQPDILNEFTDMSAMNSTKDIRRAYTYRSRLFPADHVQTQGALGVGVHPLPTKARFYRDGSCKILFEVGNPTTRILTVSASAVLINADGNSIGSTPVSFPPVLPGKKGYKEATFYAGLLAAKCRKPIAVKAIPLACQFDDGSAVFDRSCGSAGTKRFD